MRTWTLYASTVLLLLIKTTGCTAPPDTASDPAETAPDTTFYQEASWSPDGSQLLLSRLEIHNNYRSLIAKIKADGSGYTTLTEGPGDMWTTWSPDGLQIAYASQKEGNRDIYVMSADGSQPLRLTSDPAEDTHPDWSPDGSEILFVSKRDEVPHLYVMNADGSGQTKISRSTGEKWNPRWSPDGTRIVYYGAIEQGKDSVYVMNADGSDLRTLGAGIWPSWSPDGSKILYGLDQDIYEMQADGTNPRPLFEDAVMARWSPDGTRIAFIRVTWRAPQGWPSMSNLFIMNADGSGTLQLTEGWS
jgi:Tol biopolymer transport system component